MFGLKKATREKVKKYVLVGGLAIMSLSMVLAMTPLGNTGGTKTPSNALAQVGGTSITAQELQQTIESQMRNSQYGYDPRMVPVLAGTMLNQMVMQQALMLEAKKMGLEVTQAELYHALEDIPWLYPNGKYIGASQAAGLIQEQTGLTPSQFEEELRQSLVVQKLRSVVSDGVSATPAEIHDEFVRRNAKAKIEYVMFDPSQLLKAVPISPPALAAYFAAHQAQYKVPEERQVRYVLIDADNVRSMVNLTDQELEQYYSDHIDDYRVPDRVKLAQILFKTTGKTPAEVAAVEKTAKDVLTQIRAGADFGALAKKYSEDASAANGGVVGWITHGQTVKEVENAAFSLQPGEVSNLIQTSYGIQILKALDKQTAHLETFAEVKDSLQAQLEQQKTSDAETSLANQLQTQMAAHPEQFQAIAQRAGLEVKQTPLFKFNETLPDFGSSPAFQNLAFQLRPTEVGQPIAVPKGIGVIQVEQIVAAHLPQLDEARAEVEEDYRAAQSKVLAQQKAVQFAQQVKKGDFDKAAKADGYKVQDSKDFTRTDYVEGLASGATLGEAFTLSPGGTSGVVSAESGEAVFRVVSHTPAPEADFAAQRDQVAEQLLQQKRDLAFEIFEQNLKQQLIRSGEIKLNQEAMQRFLASFNNS